MRRYTDEDDASKPAQPAPEVVKPEPAVVNGSGVVKAEEPMGHSEQNDEKDQQMYNNEQDGDDDIDFNLGNSNDYREPPAQHGAHGPGIKEDG